MRPLSRFGAVAITLVAATLWGTTFPINDRVVESVTPATFAFFRFVLAAVAAFPVALIFERHIAWRLARDPVVIILGVLFAATYYAQYEGQALTTPAKASLLVNSGVFVVAVASALFLSERLSRRAWMFVAVAFVGASLVVTNGNLSTLSGGTIRGDGLILISMLAISAYMVTLKLALTRRTLPLVNLLAWTLAWCALFLAIPYVLTPRTLVSAVSWTSWGALAYTGIACTTGAFALWTWGLTRISVTTSNVLLLHEIIVAVALSWFLDLDAFTPATIIGGLLLFGAIAGVSVTTAPSRAPVAPRDDEQLVTARLE